VHTDGNPESALTTKQTSDLDVLAIGRSGVDIYPLQIGVGLEHVESFGQIPRRQRPNVAVAAARLGNRTALISASATTVRQVVRKRSSPASASTTVNVRPWRIPDTRHVLRDLPAGRLPALLYRKPSAPDLQVRTTSST